MTGADLDAMNTRKTVWDEAVRTIAAQDAARARAAAARLAARIATIRRRVARRRKKAAATERPA